MNANQFNLPVFSEPYRDVLHQIAKLHLLYLRALKHVQFICAKVNEDLRNPMSNKRSVESSRARAINRMVIVYREDLKKSI